MIRRVFKQRMLRIDTTLMPSHPSRLSRPQIDELRSVLSAASDESLGSRAIVVMVLQELDGKLINYSDIMDFNGAFMIMRERPKTHLRLIKNVLEKIIDRLD